ncbi:granzyme B(G,H)-like [Boleophthalmus pectinirostris]|uniref:granzyme B(G,H)-like n=1 Tax=Boleophthalmus pectinirostris TaxID=150288 RepID=UPI0024303684|nr:granzyme B(G,H)-like [Boleophthalmus pectinirostris]
MITTLRSRHCVTGSVIVNGDTLSDGAMQYMASVQNPMGHACGGFLVSDQFFLTAAHCFEDQPVRVVLGKHNLKESNKGQTIDIEKFFKHDSYKDVGFGNDLMLLKLNKNPEENGVKKIDLPTQNMKVKANDLCQVAGWGATQTHGVNANVLMATEVPIIDMKTCKEVWHHLPHNVICAGGYNTTKGFCQGDSGGPLVCKNTAVGVVSFNRHNNCTYKKEAPNVFVDISKYMDWILKTISFSGADGSRIVGGREAVPHSRPYIASLQSRGRHICGGLLVKEDFVLTAAHCLTPVPYTVVLGAHSLAANESSKQTFTTVRSISHPNYIGHANDIMLLRLNTTAKLTAAVQLIPLQRGRLRAGGKCITAGWGDIGDNNTYPNRLREVNVTILSQRSCSGRWGAVPITRSMVCGTGMDNFQGFCSGDSGGPLVCDGAAAGVVSFSGRRCGNPRTPDVYTRISSFRDWILSVVNN